MVPKLIDGATRHLGAPKNWNPEQDGRCGRLAIRDLPIEGGGNIMQSIWEPSPSDIMKIVAGGCVMLDILGTEHPPVAVTAVPSLIDRSTVECVDHNAAIYPLLKLLCEGRGETEIWVLIESLCLGVGLLFDRDARGTATFVETIAERMETRFRQRSQRD